MLTPGFVDFCFFLFLVAFIAKGWITGFIRSVITFVAVVVGWILSGMVPELMGPIIQYSVHYGSPYHSVVARMFTYFLVFGLVQAAGFTITGLIENIKLGTVDKFVGLCLGVATAVVFNCFLVSIWYTHPAAYWSEAGQIYVSQSFGFKKFGPMVKKFVRPPHKPADYDG